MTLERERKQLFAERLVQACIAKWGKEYGAASRLAEEMGVSVGTAARWLKGTVTPEVDRWGELATKLDVTVQWLTGATHDRPDALRGRVDDRSLNLARKAAKAVFPVVMRLKPEISQEDLDGLILYAYQQLEAGEPESSVSGELFNKLA